MKNLVQCTLVLLALVVFASHSDAIKCKWCRHYELAENASFPVRAVLVHAFNREFDRTTTKHGNCKDNLAKDAQTVEKKLVKGWPDSNRTCAWCATATIKQKGVDGVFRFCVPVLKYAEITQNTTKSTGPKGTECYTYPPDFHAFLDLGKGHEVKVCFCKEDLCNVPDWKVSDAQATVSTGFAYKMLLGVLTVVTMYA